MRGRRARLIGSIGSVTLAALAMLGVAGPAARATFPAHPGRIAFTVESEDGSQIYTMRPNGHDLRQITHVDGDAAAPDWSPDGRRIAFTLNECNVAIVDADGGGLTVIPRGGPNAADSCEGDPSFTPDGSRLVFERYDGVLDVDAVWSMDLDGSDREMITDVGGADPNVSPDGRWVGFLAGRERVQKVYRVGIHGGDAVAITPSLYGVALKWDWAPDGEHVAFTDNANDTAHAANVATIRSDGTDLRYLTHYREPDERAYVGSYSPDGHWIVFRLETGGRFALYRMRPNGRGLHAILGFSEFKPRYIDWGPAVG